MAQLRKTQEIVGFKSYPEYWEKEMNNKKPNTVRLVDEEDNRFIKLRENHYSTIRIFNSKTNEYFERQIKDVTFFRTGLQELVIISWEEKLI